VIRSTKISDDIRHLTGIAPLIVGDNVDPESRLAAADAFIQISDIVLGYQPDLITVEEYRFIVEMLKEVVDIYSGNQS
jgi:hypothetical protein